MENPFEIIEKRLIHIESLILDVKHKIPTETQKPDKNKRLTDCEISVRALTACTNAQVFTLNQLSNYSYDQAIQWKNMGKRSMAELSTLLHLNGLNWKIYIGMETTNFKERLLDERTQLENKIEKLIAFLKTDKASEIDEFQFTMLNIQLSAMTTYQQCLNARIKKL